MKTNKILLTLILSIFISTGALASNKDIGVSIDGVELKMDVAPKVTNNRTLVPMRSIFEAMGVKVEWDATSNTARGIKGSDEIKLQLGNEKATINGKEIILDVPAVAINGRILAPIRFVAESLGADVEWNGKERKVIIKTQLEEDVKFRAEEIQNTWRKLKPSFNEVKYESMPQITSPYKLGKLTDETLNNALNTTNFIRYIAHLPSGVVLDDQFNTEAQAGALVNAANDKLSHNPEKPKSMDEKLYELGSLGARTSNIGAGYDNFIESIVEGYMNDGGNSNISRVGHRRWILDPRLKKVGFGFATNLRDGNSYCNYMSMKVIGQDKSNEADESLDYVSWPAKVAMPTDYFNGYFKNYPWSVSLNNKTYNNKRTQDIKVELTRINDNKKWEFDNKSSDGFFNIDSGGYGVPFAVIFRPEEKPEYKHNDKYKVVISNIYKLDGSSEEISFETTFFNLED